jgi:hypothetical protein
MKGGENKMRKSRNGLRPVIILEWSGIKNIEGYLLHIGQTSNLEKGINKPCALIEGEDGTIIECDIYNVQFDDIEY